MESDVSQAPTQLPEQEKTRQLLESSGALKLGHFVLSSGLHSEGYVQCALLLSEPTQAQLIGEWLAESLVKYSPDSVVSPALGGVVVGHEVAKALGVRFRFAERGDDGGMSLRRGFQLERGERVVVVEDVVTTGKSTREVIELVGDLGGKVAAVGSIIDRSGHAERGEVFSVPHIALTQLRFVVFDAVDCPLCASGLPIEKPGSRKF